MTDKFFCPLPWIHQFIQADGIKMCCSSNTKLNISPVEFKNSAYLQNIKKIITDGDIPRDCQACATAEKQGYISTRLAALQDWDYTQETVPDQILYLDLRYSNLCNFSCRSCEPAFSSEIVREIQLNPNLAQFYNNSTIPLHITNDTAMEDIVNLLGTVKRINFTGGEPLLIKKNIQILEKLIAVGNTNCEILITTNGSIINNNLIELIHQFNSVHWTISIDGVKHIAEYIRYGSQWDIIDKNIHKILSFNHSVALNTVISAYSVLSIASLVQYFASLKETYNNQPLELLCYVCEYPAHLAPTILPDQLKNIAITELTSAIDCLAIIENNPIRTLDTLIHLQKNLIDSTMNTTQLTKFKKFTTELDNIRNQSFKQTFGIDLTGE